MGAIGCIKRRNTGSGMVEVHELRDDGTLFDLETPTAITLADDPHFTYDFKANIDGNHYFAAIKTKSTDTGTVEVHLLTRDSGYRSFALHTGTPITLADAPNFDFMLSASNGDLVCVKRRNTDTGMVEVHVLSMLSNYQSFLYQGATPFAVTDAVNFDFLSRVSSSGWDTLIGVKRRNSSTDTVELHALRTGYGPFDFQTPTSIPLAEASGLTFLYNTNLVAPSLLGIHGATSSGFMEIIALRNPFTEPPVTRRSVLPSSDVPNYDFKFIQAAVIAGGGG